MLFSVGFYSSVLMSLGYYLSNGVQLIISAPNLLLKRCLKELTSVAHSDFIEGVNKRCKIKCFLYTQPVPLSLHKHYDTHILAKFSLRCLFKCRCRVSFSISQGELCHPQPSTERNREKKLNIYFETVFRCRFNRSKFNLTWTNNAGAVTCESSHRLTTKTYYVLLSNVVFT